MNYEHLNRSSEKCQPCDNFTKPEFEYYGPTPHECFKKANGQYCDGHVYFCGNCNSDHHDGGYNTCAGTPLSGCAFDHPECLKLFIETENKALKELTDAPFTPSPAPLPKEK